MTDFAQFATSLFGDGIGNLADFEHSTASNVSQAAQQQFTLKIREFQSKQVAHEIEIRQLMKLKSFRQPTAGGVKP